MRENRLYGSEGGGIELNRSSLPLSGEMSLRDKHSFAALVSEHQLRVENRCEYNGATPSVLLKSEKLSVVNTRCGSRGE